MQKPTLTYDISVIKNEKVVASIVCSENTDWGTSYELHLHEGVLTQIELDEIYTKIKDLSR